jgi:hypothetical protein
MAHPRLRLLGTLFTPANLRACVRAWQPQGQGRIVLFNESHGSLLRGAAEDSDEIEMASLAEQLATFLSMAGKRVGGPTASAEQVAECVRSAIDVLDPASPFAAARLHPGLHRRLDDVLRSMRESGIEPQALRLAAARSSNAAFAQKLSDFALLEDQVHASLKWLRFDLKSERLKLCLQASLPESVKLPSFLLIVGANESMLELQWVEWLLEQGAEVTLVVENHARLSTTFEPSHRWAAALGAEIEWVGATNSLAEQLFQADVDPVEDLEIAIESAADSLFEVEGTLRACLAEKQAGTPFAEMGIFARDLHSYGPLIRSAAQRFEVPVSIAFSAPILANGLARWFARLLESLTEPVPTGLHTCLRQSYGLKPDRPAWIRWEAVYEDAIAAEGDEWSRIVAAYNPVGISSGPNLFMAEDEPTADLLLRQVMAWRERAIQQAADRPEWYRRLAELAELVPFAKAERQGASPDFAARQEMLASVERRVLVDQSRTLLSFAEIVAEWKQLWQSGEFTVASDRADGVRVSQRIESLAGCASLHVLGMLEGIFPRRRTEDAVFSDTERLAMASLAPELPMLSLSHDAARRERDLFIRICAAPTRKLTLHYPASDEDRDNVPAFYLHEVRRLAGDRVASSHVRRSAFAPPLEKCLCEADRILAAALSKPIRPADGLMIDSPAAIEVVQSTSEDSLSPSDLRDALQCEFQFALKRRFGVKGAEFVNRWGRLDQVLRTVSLPGLANEDDARNALQRALDAEIDQLRGSISKREMSLMRSYARKRVEQWIESEFVARSLWPKDEVHPGAGFDGNHLRDEIEVDGEKVTLRGKIGAVSRMGRYAIAQVYGARKGLINTPVDKLDGGQKLELAIYFAALRGKTEGVGVEMTASTGERRLFLLDRVDQSPLQAKADAGFSVISLDQSETKFMQASKALVKEALDHARANRLRAMPGEHCKFCDYGEICRRSTQFAEGWEGADVES